MSIFLNKDSKVIVQGITGGEGTKHTKLMLKAGTQVIVSLTLSGETLTATRISAGRDGYTPPM